MIKFTMIAVMALVVFGLIAQVGTIVTTGQVNQAQEESNQRNNGITYIKNARTNLADNARDFVVSGLEEAMMDYFNQIYVNRDSEYGAHLIADNDGTADENKLVQQSLEAAKAAQDTEIHAMALAALSRGTDFSTLPADLENFQFSAEERAMDPKTQLQTATDMVFGEIYSNSYKSVMSPLNRLNQIENGSVNAADTQMGRAASLQKVTIYILIAIFIVLAVTVLLFLLAALRTVRLPLSRHTEALQNHDQYDLSFRLRDDSGVPEIRDLAKAFNGQNDQVNELIGEVSGTSKGLHEHAGNLADTAAELDQTAQDTRSQAAGAAEQAQLLATNMDTLSTAMEEMQAAIRQISESATSASRISEEAVESVGSATKVIDTLGESSQSIGEITNSITSIAEQTNLLALNATIEAARAGDAGKGFAVVAGEVKDLAAQTAVATADISERVNSIQEDSTKAAEAIAQISEVIARINDSQQTIASAVEEQTATTNEMFGVVSGAAQTTQDIVGTIETVSAKAEKSAAGARTTLEAGQAVADSSSQLSKLVSRYHQ
ncbi:methyl-accepting chemotaxis protein [Mobiluncus curtisii]|nr:methyl-accepting chemotaxis protein [Mobiluncus curtisii]MCV0000775.1 methyl-accepting chemotaxis protein [Mobiluncus curtisii]MCV0021651.1 methyl-accepting chemotaxis protein [Mobiluncus curtisii]NMW48332.1 methyl-accepting chemotaxis protein [Mobiluncus curtisii]NMX13397.1 methyl-accepting chemotaxis protein [Mobiluncus curtisii]